MLNFSTAGRKRKREYDKTIKKEANLLPVQWATLLKFVTPTFAIS
jgi:hypothetical protein